MRHRTFSARFLSHTALAHGLVLGLVTVYAALSLLAFACPLDVPPAAGEHHHHGQAHHGTVAHALLCAWACQANPPVVQSSLGIQAQPVFLLIGLIVSSILLLPFIRQERIRARSPPSLLPSR